MTVRQRQFHDFEFIKLRTVRIITNCQLTNWANRCSSLQSLKFSADHQELENRTDKEAVTNILHRKAQWICLRFPFCRPGFESQANHLSFFKTICIHLHHLLIVLLVDECKKFHQPLCQTIFWSCLAKSEHNHQLTAYWMVRFLTDFQIFSSSSRTWKANWQRRSSFQTAKKSSTPELECCCFEMPMASRCSTCSRSETSPT